MSDASLPAPPPAEAVSPRSRAVYVTLGLLAGPLGCHNIYAGRWLRGALQCACAAPSLWVVEKWMQQIQPIAQAMAGSDPGAALDDLTALAQDGVPNSPLLLGALVSGVWAAVDLFVVKTDGQGRRLR